LRKVSVDLSRTDLEQLINLDDFERAAAELLPGPVFDFVAGGAGNEQSLQDNLAAYTRWRLMPRVLRALDAPADLRTTVLGSEIAMPILTAPIGYQRVVHDEGDIGIARAAAAVGTVMVMSSMSNQSHAEVAEAVPNGARWAQFYVFRDRGLTREVLGRIVGAGFSALVVTVDGIVNGLRERDVRNGFTLPEGLELPCAPSLPTAAGLVTPEQVAATWEPRLSWDHIDLCRELCGLPVVLKGILSPADAREAADRGIDGVIVSNHGGRQLDGVPATIDALPAIVEAAGEQLEVLVDGGVRRGTDVLKALALGARAVLVGRSTSFALACGGGAGVERMLRLLADETAAATTLAGYAHVRAIERDTVYR
jgi:isopentenyl diphosphate isomerase/L-lactate dehydrogenase-like FMN-dependent dehydrogenase